MNRSVLILTMVFAAALSVTASAVDYPTYKPTTPQYTAPVYSVADGSLDERQKSFSSTSPYSKQLDESATRHAFNPYDASGMQVNRSYSVPVSALSVTGGITTDEQENANGVRRVRHRPTEDGHDAVPGEPESPLPVGDTPWFFMFLLALAFASFRACRAYGLGRVSKE